MAGATTLERIVAAVPGDCDPQLRGDAAITVAGITHDSRAVLPGAMFACVRGAHIDGHDLAGEAIVHGATSLVVDHPLDVGHVPQVVVADVRRCLGWISSAVYGDPSATLSVVGITGTNGKTTTSRLLASVLEAAGRRTGVIGTLSGVRTTPEAPELQATLASFLGDDMTDVVMEVSSHALELHRVDGTTFALGIFTNLGEDHLDLHGSMEAYFRAKARLFERHRTALGVVNLDDLYGRLLVDAVDIDIVGFSRSDAEDVRVRADGMQLSWRGSELTVPLGGDFNVMHVLAAATAAEALGIERAAIVAGLAAVDPVPGRFERVRPPGDPTELGELADIDVVVDYAHTPEGLESLLRAARSLTAARGGRVLAVFGCGGDRDTQKRPHMGAVAAAGADVAIVTSDNPRHEDSLAIIDAIVQGVGPMERDHLVVEPDRAAAIGQAIEQARPGDVVVIAGKGHETTQTIGDRSLPFDDRVVAAAALLAAAERAR